MRKVSIIIPLYNAENFIGQTIKSALSQTWENIEVIVVNDGSTDNSLTLARQYEKQGVKVIDQKNAGVCSARNVGFEHSTGQFIQYLDADDCLSREKIAHQMKLLENENSISSCPWIKFENSPDEISHPEEQIVNKSMKPMDFLILAWEGGGMMQTGCWLTPRKIIEKAGPWDESILLNNDGEFFCRVMLAADQILFSPKSIAYYRQPGGDNISQQKSERAYSSLLRSYESYQHEIFRFDQGKKVRRALANNYFRFIYETSPLFPELRKRAKENIRELKVRRPVAVGGKAFRMMSTTLGFFMALKLKDWK